MDVKDTSAEAGDNRRQGRPRTHAKQGSRALRWAMVEAVQHQPAGSPPRELKDSIIDRRGREARNIAKVAAARKLLTCVFYAMRDGEAEPGHQPGWNIIDG